MKFILIVVLSATGGWSLNRWEQPAITGAVFEDRAACENAASQIKQLERNRRLDNARIDAICVAAASDDKK